MMMTVSDYVGTYYVKVVDSTAQEATAQEATEEQLSRNDKIDITVKEGEPDKAYVTITHFTEEGEEVPLLTGEEFTLHGDFGCLRRENLSKHWGHVMVISRYEQTGAWKYRALYGSVIKRDPDSVGVWGADDNLPTGKALD